VESIKTFDIETQLSVDKVKISIGFQYEFFSDGKQGFSFAAVA
jgi:hypothetical protein